MALDRVNAEEAKRLIDEEGYTLLDVRSVPEFNEAHPDGAYNVPYLHKAAHGMVPNQDFAKVVEAVFPDRSTRLVTSCQMGGRSVRAANDLQAMGYTNVKDLRGGFGGERDGAGELVHAGWKDSNLPVKDGDPGERGYRALHGALTKGDGGEGGAEALPEVANAMNRFAHASKTVECVKYGRVLPALKRTPMGGPLGKRLKKEVSAAAWDLWVEHSKMIINEYRLNPAEAKSQQMLIDQCEQFFFGEGAQLPPDFVPQSAGK